MQTLRICSTPGCPEIVPTGKCARHKRIARKKTDERVGRIRGSRWRDIRKNVFKSQAGRCFCPGCEMCNTRNKKQCFREAIEVDHIIPLRDGGAPTDRGNLRGLCHECHDVKTRAEQKAAWMNGNGHPFSKEI